MYNNNDNNQNSSSSSDHDHQRKASPSVQQPTMTSPRISFSNDFVEQQHSNPQYSRYRDAPSDFEFSVSNYSMMSADELFLKGRLLPLKESVKKPSTSSPVTTTLRDELMNQSEDDDGGGGGGEFTLRPPKNPNRWRGFLGLRKSHVGSKKSDNGGSSCSNSSSGSGKDGGGGGGGLDRRNTISGSFQFQHDDDDDDVQCSSKNSQDFDD